MSVNVDQLLGNFDNLAYTKKYQLILGLLEKRKGINKRYAGVYTFLVTSGYISESFLHKVYHHALSLAERDESQQQEEHINELIKQTKQTKQTKARIEKLEEEEKSSIDVDGLLDDI